MSKHIEITINIDNTKEDLMKLVKKIKDILMFIDSDEWDVDFDEYEIPEDEIDEH